MRQKNNRDFSIQKNLVHLFRSNTPLVKGCANTNLPNCGFEFSRTSTCPLATEIKDKRRARVVEGRDEVKMQRQFTAAGKVSQGTYLRS